MAQSAKLRKRVSKCDRPWNEINLRSTLKKRANFERIVINGPLAWKYKGWSLGICTNRLIMEQRRR